MPLHAFSHLIILVVLFRTKEETARIEEKQPWSRTKNERANRRRCGSKGGRPTGFDKEQVQTSQRG
ncbi:hypothetical protein GCM10010342_76750 [Streptomyces anulatus]|nr:hypothetical protein GCM10010342_76750 [Streptomyces anulatus]